MIFPQGPSLRARKALTGSDPLLQPFLFSTTPEESAEQLRVLLEVEAAPIMRWVLQRQAYAAAGDHEDVLSSVRAELIEHLTLLRAGEKLEPIANFRAYTGAVAYAIWAQHLRRAHPARSMLLDRLRYLWKRTRQRGFALWTGEADERWCGLDRWRKDAVSAAPSIKLQRLLVSYLSVRC